MSASVLAPGSASRPVAPGGLPSHRLDIDGLRGIAVLAVIAFHALPLRAPSGFIGVDLFFVLSGFLITGGLGDTLARGRFSFAEFYARRLRRIAPALIVVLAACLAAGWLLLVSREYAPVGSAAAAGAAFVSNVLSYRQRGYFDAIAESKPLLHLWSLGVEMQFYLLWPALIAMLWPHRRWRMAGTSLLTIASFALCLTLVRTDSSAAYYLPWARLWEFGAGGCLALAAPRWLDGSGIAVRTVLGALGLALIAIALTIIGPNTAFPGWQAALPVVGGALVIAAGPTAWTNRLIAQEPLAWIGRVSYPLYLWHWPMLVIARTVNGTELTHSARAILIAASLVLAWLTHVFVERPTARRPAMRIAPLAVAALCGVGLAGAMIARANGVPHRATVSQSTELGGDVGHDAFFAAMRARWFPCEPASLVDGALPFNGRPRCAQSHPGAAIDLALIGDSQAEQIFPGLADALPERHLAYYLRTGAPSPTGAFAPLYNFVASTTSIRDVVVGFSWTGLLRSESADAIVRDIAPVLTRLVDAGKHVSVIGDLPAFSVAPLRCAVDRRTPFFEIPRRCDEPIARSPAAQAILAALHTREPRAPIVDLWPVFCSADACSMRLGGDVVFRDANHLNTVGSRAAADALVAALALRPNGPAQLGR